MGETAKQTAQLREILASAKHAVFFGGAGVSTDSGIPDFRGPKGLYREEENNEYYLSKECLTREPAQFYRFFRDKMLYPDAQPNPAHRALAELERRGILKAVITQNIDGLHQKAGSQRVIELHGTARSYTCTVCKKQFGEVILTASEGIPQCPVCWGLVRPDVTLYGEALDGFSFMDAEREIRTADVLIVGGSSLTVQPAASLVRAFTGDWLIIVNYSPTPYDGAADLILRRSLSEVLSGVVN